MKNKVNQIKEHPSKQAPGKGKGNYENFLFNRKQKKFGFHTISIIFIREINFKWEDMFVSASIALCVYFCSSYILRNAKISNWIERERKQTPPCLCILNSEQIETISWYKYYLFTRLLYVFPIVVDLLNSRNCWLNFLLFEFSFYSTVVHDR